MRHAERRTYPQHGLGYAMGSGEGGEIVHQPVRTVTCRADLIYSQAANARVPSWSRLGATVLAANHFAAITVPLSPLPAQACCV